jgi:hypothetical protein
MPSYETKRVLLESQPSQIDLVRLLGRHLQHVGGAELDAEAVTDFLTSLSGPAVGALQDPSLLRGLGTERLFFAMVGALGTVTLIKEEDSGEIWPADTGLRIPDYLIALPDASTILVEVKHFYQKGNPTKRYRLSKKYLRGLRMYADAVGCEVKLAVYWAQWNLWTLVPLELCEETASPSLTLEVAMQFNEMHLLGDVFIATEFPLRLRLVADERAPRSLSMDNDGTFTAPFTIGSVELYCADRRITAKTECGLAMWFMLNGSWEEENLLQVDDNRQVVASEFIYRPSGDSGQRFAMLGSLSSMFSAQYGGGTDRGLSRLGIRIQGNLPRRLVPGDYTLESLPLWRFKAIPPKSTTATGHERSRT